MRSCGWRRSTPGSSPGLRPAWAALIPLYLETLVQLVQAYEAEHHAIDTTGLTGLDSLKHLLEENQMNASDLARLLGVHPSLGSKILKGERSLTVAHIRKLAERFKVSPGLFLD